MKKLYIDTTTGLLTAAAGSASPLAKLEIKRGDTLDIEWVFSTDLAEYDQPIFGAKAIGSYDADPILLVTDSTPPGGAQEGHAMAILAASSELTTALGTAASVTLMAELTVIKASGARLTTQTFDLVIHNDVVQDGETDPYVPDLYPSPDNLVLQGEIDPVTAHADLLPAAIFPQIAWQITGLTGGGATHLDGIPTADGGMGDGGSCVLLVVIGGAASLYQLVSGTDAEAAPGIIRPDDYDSIDNAKVWRRVL